MTLAHVMTTGDPASVPTHITFPPSLDSEFSRFLLTHYGIERREERHVIFISSAIAKGTVVPFAGMIPFGT